MEPSRSRVLVTAGLVVGLGVATYVIAGLGEATGVATQPAAPVVHHGQASHGDDGDPRIARGERAAETQPPSSPVQLDIKPVDVRVYQFVPRTTVQAPEYIRRARERVAELLKGPFPVTEEDAVRIALDHAELHNPVVVRVERDIWQGDLREGRVVYVVVLSQGNCHLGEGGICPHAVLHIDAHTGEIVRRELIS